MFRKLADRLIRACLSRPVGRTLTPAHSSCPEGATGDSRASARVSQKGQASVMIAIMMVTFIMFFAFVVNTGMLVNAKINLQNAADLAAYAGAATQARQLNEISFLNYEMRRQYKKFLFRYYVIGNMAQGTFPVNGTLPNGPLWAPDGRPSGRVSYGIPTTCIIFDRTNNFCQLTATKALVFPPENLLDQITQTLRAQYSRIEQIRQCNCLSIGNTNVQILMLWLYNTDPDLVEYAANLGNNPEAIKTVQIVRGLASGLGLIPHEVILRARIDTLSKYLNEGPRTSVQRDLITTLQGEVDPSKHERTINAFLSAYNTLGNHTFSSVGDIVMTEFLHPGTEGMLKLQNIKASFDTYATTFTLTGGAAGSDPRACTSEPRQCSAILRPITVKDVPIGVFKDPSVMTYYAIRLKAKARVLFSIFGDLDLKAYSAAQPFGSKIGPALQDQDYVRLGVGPPSQFSSGGLLFSQTGVPNLPIKASDTTAQGSGWDNAAALGAYYIKLRQPGATSDAPVLGPQDLERAYHAAMSPNPWEEVRYNILNDLPAPASGGQDNRTTQYFDSNLQAAFWAPVVPPDSSNGAADLKNSLDSLFSTGAGSGGGVGSAPTNPNEIPAEVRTALQAGLTKYLTALGTDSGENGDGINVMRINNAFFTRPEGSTPPTPITDPAFATTSLKARNSWTPKIDEPGRTGYSVKFIAFSTLTDNKTKTNGTTSWSNDPDWGDGEDDVKTIKH